MQFSKVFQVRLFSNVNLEIYPENTLAIFTNKLNVPIEFDEGHKYYCALKEIFLPLISYASDNAEKSKDIITFNYETNIHYSKMPDMTTSIRDLVHFFLHKQNKEDLSTYNLSYFAPYLNKNIIFDPHTFYKIFERDVVYVQKDKEKEAENEKNSHKFSVESSKPVENSFKIILDLSELIDEKSEKIQDFFPLNYDEHTKKTFTGIGLVFGKFQPYTLRQLLNVCIRFLFTKLRMNITNQQSFTEFYHRNFSSWDIFIEKSNSQNQKHQDIIRRFINKFVSEVQIFVKERLARDVILQHPSFIYVYVDVITENLIGNERSKILHIISLASLKTPTHISITNLNYNLIEKKLITSISVSMYDEYGRVIKFQNSIIPVYCCLEFQSL